MRAARREGIDIGSWPRVSFKNFLPYGDVPPRVGIKQPVFRADER